MSQYFWPESFRINEVVDSLRRHGCAVTVLTGQPNYPDGVVARGYCATGVGTQMRDGLTVHRVPLAPRGSGSATRLALNYLSFVVSAAAFGPWLLRGQRIDAILVYAPSPILQAIPAVWLAWLKGARLVTWVQDLWPQSLQATGFVRSRRLLRMVAAVVRWIYRHNDLLLVQSRAFIDPVTGMAGGTPVVYHPNPGDMALSQVRASTELPLKLGPGFNVVFAGNLGTVQSLDTVLAAARLLRDATDIRFVLVGSGSRAEWVGREIRRLGLTNVDMPGRFAPEDMPPILSQASVLLVSLAAAPALAQTVPSKIQAYLAAGKPIIASLDGEGAKVVQEAGAGITCPAEDARALADAVRHLHALPEQERVRMAVEGRRYYERHFEPGMLALRLCKHFEVLLGRSDATRHRDRLNENE